MKPLYVLVRLWLVAREHQRREHDERRMGQPAERYTATTPVLHVCRKEAPVVLTIFSTAPVRCGYTACQRALLASSSSSHWQWSSDSAATTLVGSFGRGQLHRLEVHGRQHHALALEVILVVAPVSGSGRNTRRAEPLTSWLFTTLVKNAPEVQRSNSSRALDQLCRPLQSSDRLVQPLCP